ncbi:uncharacterized protein LOC130823605 isoform X1 [Amaranthus tricolor]|uniref:uncharacterized protein LOC130823605 isoform X1 n=1 Tax=Amaranthus tricolor TaxID=29722 RepID=UPI00258877D7|nr:uncharacterized protein LOC130823605 isoform X1 [Amaranthus tricolor]
MASPYDPFKQEPINQQQQKKRGPNLLLLLPLIYAPVLPLKLIFTMSRASSVQMKAILMLRFYWIELFEDYEGYCFLFKYSFWHFWHQPILL